MTTLLIISGFLGAGKTTFIEKLIKTKFNTKNIALIENDFGEISVDAEKFKNRGLKISELNSGCICCNLNGSFNSTITNLITDIKPELIILEPSGIAKTSDIIKKVKNLNEISKIFIVNVIDVNSIKKYYDNYGELFDNQIINADLIFLSHYENQSLNIVHDILNELNISKKLLTDLHSAIKYTINEISYNTKNNLSFDKFKSDKNYSLYHQNNNKFNIFKYKPNKVYGDFISYTINIDKFISVLTIEKVIDKIISNFDIIRIKGFFSDGDYYYEIQYNASKLNIIKTNIKKNYITIIGKNFNKNDIEECFNYE